MVEFIDVALLVSAVALFVMGSVGLITAILQVDVFLACLSIVVCIVAGQIVDLMFDKITE